MTESETKRYLIEDKHFSLDNRFTITDESGNIRYKGNSTFFTVGDKFVLCDENGNELIRIRQENLRLHPTYKLFSIHSSGTEHQIASIKKIGSMWQSKLEITTDNGEYLLQKKSGVASKDFDLTKDGHVIATAVKDSSATKNFFWLDILDENEPNHAFIIALVIVLSSAQRL